MNRPVHFEIHADDFDRCSKFYGDLFGRTFTKRDNSDVEYMMVVTGTDGLGINGGMVKRQSARPVPGGSVSGYVCTIEVESVDTMLEKAVAAGAKVTLPKMPIPGMGRLAYLIDTEGNIFGIMNNDTSAA